MKLVGAMLTYNNKGGEVIKAADSLLEVVKCDEVFILDGGSTDSTVQDLGRYGNRVRIIHHKWPDRFDTQRNRLLDEIRAWANESGIDWKDVWVVWLDADDWFITFPPVPSWADVPDNVHRLTITHTGQKGGSWHYETMHRLTDNWKGINHSVLIGEGDAALLQGAEIIHGWSSQHKADPERKIRHGRLGMKEEPNNGRYMFYLIRDLLEANTGTQQELNDRFKEALELAKRYFCDGVENRFIGQDAHFLMVVAAFYTRYGQWQDAKKYVSRALELNGNMLCAQEAMAVIQTKIGVVREVFPNVRWEHLARFNVTDAEQGSVTER